MSASEMGPMLRISMFTFTLVSLPNKIRLRRKNKLEKCQCHLFSMEGGVILNRSLCSFVVNLHIKVVRFLACIPLAPRSTMYVPLYA